MSTIDDDDLQMRVRLHLNTGAAQRAKDFLRWRERRQQELKGGGVRTEGKGPDKRGLARREESRQQGQARRGKPKRAG